MEVACNERGAECSWGSDVNLCCIVAFWRMDTSAAAWASMAQTVRHVTEVRSLPQLLLVLGFGIAVALTVRAALHLLAWLVLHISPALERKRLPPGRWGFLWVEETVRFLVALHHGEGELLRFLKERTDRYSSCTFRTSVFFQPTVVFQGVKANAFLASCERRQEAVNEWPPVALKLMGKNAPVNVHGAQHRRQTQIMSKFLGSAGLKTVVGRVDLMTREHIRSTWIEAAANGGPMLIADAVKRHLVRLSLRLLAGVEDDDTLSRMQSNFRVWSTGMGCLPVYLPGTAYHKAYHARDALRRDVDSIISALQQRLASSAPAADVRSSEGDLLSELLLAQDDEGATLSRHELEDLTLFLLIASFESSASTLSSALKFLEQDPSCRDRLLAEHHAIASERGKNQTLDWTDITKMEFTWAVLQETLRLKNPVTGSMKTVCREIKYDGYSIPKGWKILINFASTHTSEECFKDATRFDPSRFEVEPLRKERHPPFAFVPFGIGPHTCKGVEFARMTLCLYMHHLILSNLKWTSVHLDEGTTFPAKLPSEGYPAIVSLDKRA